MEKKEIHILGGDCENMVSGPYWSTLNFVHSLLDIGYDVVLEASYKSLISKEYQNLKCKKLYFHKRCFTNGILSTFYVPKQLRNECIVVSTYLFNLAFLFTVMMKIITKQNVDYVISIRGETYSLNWVKLFYVKVLFFLIQDRYILHFLTKNEADLFREKLGPIENFIIVGNGVTHYPDFSPGVERSIEYAVFSRIHPDKGIRRALEIFGNEITIFGKASTSFEKTFLESLIVDFPKANIAGPVDSDEKFLKLAEIKYLIFLTKREGFPMLLLEALVAGCRLVTTMDANVPDDLKDFVLIVDPMIERAELERLISNYNWDESAAYDFVIKNYRAKQQTKKIFDKCLQY